MRIGCSEIVRGVRYYSLDINTEYREKMMQELAVSALELPDDLITEDEIEFIIKGIDTRFKEIKYSSYTALQDIMGLRTKYGEIKYSGYTSWQDAIKEYLLDHLRQDENEDGSDFTIEHSEMYEIFGRIDCE